ncbi:MAG: AraC family transcriptional regulator, partial [Ruminiclostridium sp.]|nr:AraC family transcriptional regulator [Ruminiclostridium sp.]
MDYIEGLNLSIEYIEEHLFEEIDFEKAARTAGMSRSTYQRFFLMLINMTLEEYVRKRRLWYAVRELTNTKQKIIDIAVKYGYNSAAFSRAIRSFTGKAPSEIRKDGSSVFFPKLNFELRITENEMAVNERAVVKIEDRRNEKVVCFDADCVDPEGEAWGLMSEWCKRNVPDRAARKYVGIAPLGHHPQDGEHTNSSEHIK